MWGKTGLPHLTSRCTFKIKAGQRACGGLARPLYRFGRSMAEQAGNFCRFARFVATRKIAGRNRDRNKDAL
jgi:hypothetical protein